MKMQNKRTIALAAAALIIIAAAAIVRLQLSARYRQTRIAYAKYVEQTALQQKAEAEATANEQKLAGLRAAVAHNPKDTRARWALAAELQKFKMLPDALDQLQEIQRLDPNDQLAAVGIANLELALTRLKDAERSFEAATRKFPKNIEAWQGLAAVQYQLRQFRNAGQSGRHALSIDPNDRDSKLIVASSALEFAQEYPDQNETRDPLLIAQTLYTMLAKDEPTNGQFQYQLGLTKFLLRDKKGSLPHLQKAATLLPDRANIAADYAQALISTGKYAEARAVLNTAVPRMPKVAALHHLIAESYQYDSDPKSVQEAIAASKKAVELSPTSPTYLDRLGSAYLKAQDINNARISFEKSLLLNANRSYPYQQLAGIYTRMGDAKRASIAAKMATRMVANDETMRHLEALSAQYPGATNLLLVRAKRYRDLKMYGPARDLYQQTLSIDPANAEAKRAIEEIDKARLPDTASK
jgi:Flp pilus assembly protein TadD